MEFKTIKEDGMVQEEIKKSRFICHVKRVYSEEEARAFIAAIKKNITRLPITALLLSLEKRAILSGPVMMGSPAEQPEFLCWEF